MNLKLLYPAVLLVFLAGCNKDTDLPVPSPGSTILMQETHPLSPASQGFMDGVYQVTTGSDKFGEYMVLKWNRNGVLITNSNGKHFIMQAGHLDSVVFVQGYWRDGYSDGTGLCNLYIARSEGGSEIVTGNGTQQIILRGAYGYDNNLPDQPLVLEYLRPFTAGALDSNFYILSHRAGGRTSDRLPVSENCVAMINFTESLGTTGIEVDVRLSSDGVAFLYHDPDINTRLTQKCPLSGDISAYNWFQLSNFVKLIHGERIPTLEEALTFTVDSTNLRFVYLDMKSAEAIPEVVRIQKLIMQRAQQKGRDLLVVIGIPATDVMEALMAEPDYQNIPSLCELTVEDAETLNSRVWAPRWTLGTQNDLVAQVHAEGRLAVCWTIDNPNWIKTFLNEGQFNGLLTNFPYVVAYHHYIQD
jgi:glycerophosphoryl diester phosphodiesterase